MTTGAALRSGPNIVVSLSTAVCDCPAALMATRTGHPCRRHGREPRLVKPMRPPIVPAAAPLHGIVIFNRDVWHTRSWLRAVEPEGPVEAGELGWLAAGEPGEPLAAGEPGWLGTGEPAEPL